MMRVCIIFIFVLFEIEFIAAQNREFTGCENLVQFSLNNGKIIGNIDYHFSRNAENNYMFADVRGFLAIETSDFSFQIKHENGEEWICANRTNEYPFMACQHELKHSDKFTVSLKTSSFLPNLLELNQMSIDANYFIGWDGFSFKDNCINRIFKYNSYMEPVNVQQSLCCWP